MVKNAHREDRDHIGTHVICEMWDCDFDDDAERLVVYLINAAHASNARILDTVSHQFTPAGSTALLLLAESHMSAHTWPEYGYIAIDIFTCGSSMKPDEAIAYLEQALKPKRVETTKLVRGRDGKPR